MDCCSAIKKNEVMPFAITWVDPESVILGSKSDREEYSMTSAYEESEK